ncbi:hypothetical protein HMPREF3212_00215 [Citrobacter freundii]|nr:hypothetical protein HMPREF3212_00215 [Citrobacter freundii]
MQGITKKTAFSETGYKKRPNPAIWTGTSGFLTRLSHAGIYNYCQ